MRRSKVCAALCLGLFAWSAALAAGAERPAAAGGAVKTLFLVGGDYHDYDEAPRWMAQQLEERLQAAGPFEFVITKDLDYLRAEKLQEYDLLMLSMCQQTELSTEQKQGFLKAVENGLPIVALHCTFWCFQSWPEFRQVLGAFVPGHAPYGQLCAEVVEPEHLIASGTASPFELTDEPYFADDRDPAIEVLVETCKRYEGRGGVEPQIWTKTHGKGRVFAMTFGHDAKSQRDPTYLRLLSRGMLWALKRLQ